MEELGHFEEVEDRKIPMKYSDRSKTPIEPYLSDQWFVKMDELAQSAMDAVDDGRVRIFPQRYTKTYMDWLGEKRDWCISRQLWWGHRIPVWSLEVDSPDEITSDWPADAFSDKSGIDLASVSERLSVACGESIHDGKTLLLACVPEECSDLEEKLEAAGFEQDPDVLDTWFSSALWPHATLGWPDTEHNPPLAELVGPGCA